MLKSFCRLDVKVLAAAFDWLKYEGPAENNASPATEGTSRASSTSSEGRNEDDRDREVFIMLSPRIRLPNLYKGSPEAPIYLQMPTSLSGMTVEECKGDTKEVNSPVDDE
jgi:hypothetical protein